MDLIGPIGEELANKRKMPDGIQHPDACDGTLSHELRSSQRTFPHRSGKRERRAGEDAMLGFKMNDYVGI